MLKFNHGRFELEQLSFSIPDNLYLTSVGEMQIENGFELFVPPLRLCGDNGAMIGAQGYYEYLAGNTAASDLNAYATMEL